MSRPTTTCPDGARLRRSRATARADQSGLSLIETAAALGIVALMLASFGKLTAENQVAQRSRATAILTAQVTQAATQYIQANYSDVLAQTAGGTVQVYVPSGKLPTGADQTGTGGLRSMQAKGFLSETYRDRNPFGQQTGLIVKQAMDPVTGAPNGRLEGMVLTFGGQTIPDAELGRIATSVGASGGFVASKPPPGAQTTDITGAYGGWNTKISDWTANGVSVGAGHIASTLAFQTGVGQDEYLNRYDQGDGGESQRMHANILMNGFNISGAGDVGTGTVTASGQVSAGSVKSPTIQGSDPATSMLFSMDGNKITNAGQLIGVVQSDGSRQVAIGNSDVDSVKVNGSLTTTNSISSQQDIQGQSLTAASYVAAGKLLDNTDQQVGYGVDPGAVSDVRFLNTGYLNVDTQIYGSTVNIGQKDSNGKLFGLPTPAEAASAAGCAKGDMACVNTAYDNAVKNYTAAVAAATTAKPMTLGDLLPSMVARGLFVVGSDGTVTDGQPGSTSTIWSDGDGGAIGSPTGVTQPLSSDPTEGGEYGFVLQPSCGSNGVPQIYLSKFDDSMGFSMKTNPDGTPLINVTTNPGGSINGAGGFTGTGPRVQGYWLDSMTTSGNVKGAVSGVIQDPVVTDVAVGDGVNLAPSVVVSSLPIGGRNWWRVLVSKKGEFQPDGTPGKVYLDSATGTYKQYVTGTKFYNGSTWQACVYDGSRSMQNQDCGHVRKVLAQTFCNYNNVRKDFAAGVH